MNYAVVQKANEINSAISIKLFYIFFFFILFGQLIVDRIYDLVLFWWHILKLFILNYYFAASRIQHQSRIRLYLCTLLLTLFYCSMLLQSLSLNYIHIFRNCLLFVRVIFLDSLADVLQTLHHSMTTSIKVVASMRELKLLFMYIQ